MQLEEMGITGSSYSLFIPLGLEAGSFSTGGDIALQVSYTTSVGVDTLLYVDLSSQQTLAIGDAQAEFYLLPPPENMDPNLDLTPANQITLGQLQALLASDESDSELTNPIYIGIVLDDIAVPTTTLSDGSLAHIDVDTRVSDSASSPY
jgi:hypothetical protein